MDLLFDSDTVNLLLKRNGGRQKDQFFGRHLFCDLARCHT